MSDSESHFFLKIPAEKAGERIDKVLAELLPEHSRSAIQQWISQGRVRIAGKPIKQKSRVAGLENLEIDIPKKQNIEAEPENIPLNIVYEDGHIVVINKPAGLVVHPGAGNPRGTLLNGLLFHQASLAALPRAGIVHRLDKDTSGIMVVAKTELARQRLIEQLESRTMKRQYVAVCEGVLISGETINQAIGRSRYDRLKMSVTRSGKSAITHLRVVQKFRMHTLVEASLQTGRTHQIRVHMSWRGFSLVGDRVYGNRNRFPTRATAELITTIQNFNRQALHARRLALIHPNNGENMQWEVPQPADLAQLVKALENDWDNHFVRN